MYLQNMMSINYPFRIYGACYIFLLNGGILCQNVESESACYAWGNNPNVDYAVPVPGIECSRFSDVFY
ncbi:hypothetical protein [Bacillus wiedmannii]|uniref:hypothetical protein n=1 Tax=Bacillus wiedmannii TaxID=1890302 RepID=UPI002EC6C5F3|nr:hypothetical protein [Bacillus wiedmannii]